MKRKTLGNTIQNVASVDPKELSRADKKKLMKQRKDMIKNGEDTYDIDVLLGLE